ncbi:MoxR-like ATPase [Paraburkholderia unamae]|uniref:ATP-binding protein n=1 Tax=Paraburkholderia unamae TaxID=219649 RepID=UPI001CB5600C|nr:ATP-binding protein [Paraburkholderia unamae]CAG9254990.1 MoxR-like ATPase [Paraburkholderia unamae]
MQVNVSQLKALLTAYVPKRLPVLITGRPGIGKSDIVEQVSDALDHDLMISHPVVEDPTDSKGLPFAAADGRSARFLPFGDLEHALQPRKRPLIWFLDDLGQASPAVQAAKMQLLLARRIGEHRLPDNVTFLAATNRRNDNAGVSGILDPLISRFATVVELEATIEEWTAWAVANDVAPELIAFLRFRPGLLSVQKTSRDIEATPSPRSWGFVAKTMGVVPKDLELISYAGSVGEGAAGELMGFIQIYRQLPSPDLILAAPDAAPIPDAPAALYAISAALAMYAKESNFARVLTYTNRLIDAGLSEFAALLVTDAVRKSPALASTHDFIRECTGSDSRIGKLIHG